MPSSDNNILISMVGLQPGAIYSTALTLKKHCGVTGIILLPTPNTEKNATQLKELLGQCFNVTIEPVSGVLNKDDGSNILNMVCKQLDAKATANNKVYLDISPGLNFLVGYLSAGLKERNDFIPVYAEGIYLHNLLKSEHWKLENIGLEKLLELYGQKKIITGNETSSPQIHQKDYCIDVQIEHQGETLHFDFMFESRGRVWLCKWIKNVEKDERKQLNFMARRLKALTRDTRALAGLKPSVCIVVKDQALINRLKAFGQFHIFPYSGDDEEKVIPLMHKIISELDALPPQPVSISSKEEKIVNGSIPVKGNGGPNPSLAVCLGTDPSSTLQAIYAHQPDEAFVFHDIKSEFISIIAGRIRDVAKELPVGKIHFLPTTICGDFIEKTMFPANKPTLTNISPGSKAQTWRLAALFDKNSIYSLDRDGSLPLFGDPDGSNTNTYRYTSIPLSVLAKCCGGKLVSPPIHLKDIETNKVFLNLFVSFVTYMSKGNKWLGWRKEGERKTVFCKNNSEKIRYTVVLENIEQDEHGCELLHFQIEKNIESTKNGKKEKEISKETGILPGPVKEGFWLEHVIAYAFVRNQEEHVQDIAVGLRWQWQWQYNKKKPNEKIFRTDLDIALVWDNDILAISCKGGVKEEDIDNVREEIVGVARTGLGRFCLPVLVRPLEEEVITKRILEIPLSKLADDQFIRKSIKKYIKLQKTTR